MATAIDLVRQGVQAQQNITQPASTWTDAKIKKVALYVLATVVALAGVALITLSAITIIPLPFVFAGLVLFAVSGGLIYWACSIKDYDNPAELRKMTEKAWNQSYSKLRQEHGDNIGRVLPQSVLNEKQRFESQLHAIHLKFPARQERLIAALNVKADNARARAAQPGNDVRMLGMTASFAGGSLSRSNVVTGLGLTTTAAAAAIVDYTQEVELRKQLEAIEAEKSQIYASRAGLEEQRNYQAECTQARQTHDDRIAQMRAAG